MPSPFRLYLDRSINKLKRDTANILRSDLSSTLQPPLTLYSFTSALKPTEGPDILAKGSDSDIGGLSTAYFTPVPHRSSLPLTPPTTPPPAENTPSSEAFTNTESNNGGPSMSHVAFHGNMSLRVPSRYVGKLKSGYAGMRNRKRVALFGEDTWDLSLHSHLRIVVAYRGWEGWRNRWYCNIQTDGPILTDLFQHRLEIPPLPTSTPSPSALDPTSGPEPQFSTLHLPLNAFVLTNSGQTAEHQIEMLYSKIRTVGFSLLGGGRGEEGMPSIRPPPSQKAVEDMRRLASGGWGTTGSDQPDAEIEALLEEDGILQQQPQSSRQDSAPATVGGYHRVGAVRPSQGFIQADATEGSVNVTPWSEGYYELCVRSVEAVNHDPMNDDVDDGPEGADM